MVYLGETTKRSNKVADMRLIDIVFFLTRDKVTLRNSFQLCSVDRIKHIYLEGRHY